MYGKGTSTGTGGTVPKDGYPFSNYGTVPYRTVPYDIKKLKKKNE